jgi:hypothetical protein
MGKTFSLLDAPLLQLSPHDQWDVRASCSHTLILGTTGSGKSSGSYRSVIESALKLGAGALFCIAKPEDAETIRSFCARAGRLSSLIDWNGRDGGFNVLAYVLARTQNLNDVIDMMMCMFEIVRGSGSSPGKANDQFWTDSSSQKMRATIPVVYAATGMVRVEDILLFIRSAPTSVKQMRDPKWQASSPFGQMFTAAIQRLEAGPVLGFDVAVCQRAIAYWEEFAALDPKTSGNIRISITTLLSRFETGLLKDALCSDCDIFPDLMLSGGAILLMNFPVQTHGEDAAIVQKIVKYASYQTILARNGMPPHMRDRLILIGGDECQNFFYRDPEFLAQCRSSNTMVVFATQSLPTIYAKIGGDHPHDRGQHFVGSFNNVILHSSGCPETNEWFGRKLGRTTHMRSSVSQGQGGGDNFGLNMGEGTNWGTNSSFGSSSSSGSGSGSGSSSSNSSHGSSYGSSDNWGRSRGTNSSWNAGQSWSEQSDWVIEPGFFARGLKTGGTAYRGRVTAVWFRAGHSFAATNSNFMMVEFQQ